MKGFDDQWIGTDRPSVTYMNLKPGRYRLVVKGANNDGIWSDEKELSIIVLPLLANLVGLSYLHIAVLRNLIRNHPLFYLRELIKRKKPYTSTNSIFSPMSHTK
ncbi:hypothetical protein LWM68_17475 [Niabella sp. W65]|nr:hypothetical protein [Niabella sp. W65]MCH7364379.1 hypothetical protein [Niabella sp. W65]